MKASRVFKRALRSDGLIVKILLYSILIGISFIYLYPILRMLAMSLMTLEDLNDVQRNWLPSSLYFNNYVKAFKSLDYMKVKNHITGTNVLSGVYSRAADVSGDGKISSLDYMKIKNQIMGTSKISL